MYDIILLALYMCFPCRVSKIVPPSLIGRFDQLGFQLRWKDFFTDAVRHQPSPGVGSSLLCCQPTRRYIMKKITESPFPSSYPMSIAPELVLEFHAHLPPSVCDFCLVWACAYCCNHGEFLCAPAVLFLENTVSLILSPIRGSYSLSGSELLGEVWYVFPI